MSKRHDCYQESRVPRSWWMEVIFFIFTSYINNIIFKIIFHFNINLKRLTLKFSMFSSVTVPDISSVRFLAFLLSFFADLDCWRNFYSTSYVIFRNVAPICGHIINQSGQRVLPCWWYEISAVFPLSRVLHFPSQHISHNNSGATYSWTDFVNVCVLGVNVMIQCHWGDDFWCESSQNGCTRFHLTITNESDIFFSSHYDSLHFDLEGPKKGYTPRRRRAAGPHCGRAATLGLYDDTFWVERL